MCEICHHDPCLGRCPNAEESPIIKGYCEICGEPLNEGDDAIRYDGRIFHRDCFLDNYSGEA